MPHGKESLHLQRRACHRHSKGGTLHREVEHGRDHQQASFQYGLYEAYLNIAHGVGVDNAFWLTSQGDLNDGTGDSFEIDIAEVYYPALVRSTLHRHNMHRGGGDRHETGYNDQTKGNLAAGFHDYGLLWTPTTLVFCLDGVAFQTIETKGTINVPANLRLITVESST
jgi:beta-glucanase (GH16 family)